RGARRGLRTGSVGNCARKEEDRRTRPGRWVVAEPLPDEKDLLPEPAELALPPTTRAATAETAASQRDSQGGGTVAADFDPPSQGLEDDGDDDLGAYCSDDPGEAGL